MKMVDRGMGGPCWRLGFAGSVLMRPRNLSPCDERAARRGVVLSPFLFTFEKSLLLRNPRSVVTRIIAMIMREFDRSLSHNSFVYIGFSDVLPLCGQKSHAGLLRQCPGDRFGGGFRGWPL